MRSVLNLRRFKNNKNSHEVSKTQSDTKNYLLYEALRTHTCRFRKNWKDYI